METIIIKRGRPIKSPDGIPNSKPIDKEYFNKYYQANLAIKVQCDHCGELISKSKINQHMKTNKCINALDELKTKCLICSKHIYESRKKQHEKSSYCKSFTN
jgi:hypothetical protein